MLRFLTFADENRRYCKKPTDMVKFIGEEIFMANKSLNQAKKDKNDEFYTQLADIENELRHYKQYFKDKVVFCNCDDPFESNFFKYFALNFNHLGLKKLLATSYDSSPIAYTQLSCIGGGGMSA